MAATTKEQKALSKLNRAELLEMLLAASKQNEELQKRNEQLEAALADRTITINEAGSIAEASLQINGVFFAAEAAASQWLENITTLNDRCTEIQAEAERKAAATIESANIVAKQVLEDAQREADEYWTSLSTRLENFYSEHQGLKELIEKQNPDTF